MRFKGYLRSNGLIGIRNKILIIALDECCDGIAKRISKNFSETVVLTNHYTCMLGGNEETYNQIINICSNPNIAAVLAISMGCGSIMPNKFLQDTSLAQKPIEILSCIELGGTKKTIQKGYEIIKKFKIYADTIKRQEVEINQLRIGVKCGGSDTSSGLASNPSVGKAVDILVDKGATVIAGELIELMGCDNVLMRRVVNEETGKQIIQCIHNELKRWSIEGVECESMSIGNCIGGLTTIEEKSYGALHKTGTCPIQGILQINQRGIDTPKKPGFYLSDTSHLCGGAGVNFAALGVSVILWTSGAAGFDTELIPVIKVSGNKELINEDIDVDVTGILEGTETLNEAGEKVVNKLLTVCNGEKTNTEDFGSSFLTLYQKDIRVEKLLNIDSIYKCNK